MTEATRWTTAANGIKSIECTSCPAHCCKVLPALHPIYRLPINAAGHCDHLLADKCSIYSTRPAICRTHKMLDNLMDQTAAACDLLKANDE